MSEITAVLIAKNEAKIIERCIRSVKNLGDVVVLDTGSVDATPEIAQQAGAKVYVQPPAAPFHFAEARNLALGHVETPWALSIDADEVLRGGSVAKLLKAVHDPAGATAFTVSFTNIHPTIPTLSFLTHKVKLFRRDAWHWKYRVHEQLVPVVAGAQIGDANGAIIDHQPLPDKKARHSQNIDLLKLCVKENPEYVRAFRHLAQELMLKEQWAEAVPYFYHYIDKTEESNTEKSVAMTRMALCLINQGGLGDDVLEWLRRAAEADPRRREPIFWSGRYCMALAKGAADLDRAVAHFQAALDIKDDGTPFGTGDDPEAWDNGLLKRLMKEARNGIAQFATQVK